MIREQPFLFGGDGPWMAGWRRCGVTKTRKLLIFEYRPEWGQHG